MQVYDLVVIGGGIHGAGVAQAAAAAGYRVLILERNSWAAGTSSKSSKLIHGGLRYLQSGQFQLVWECLRERELLLRIAPDLVSRSDFYIPVYKQSKFPAWQIGLGLMLYSLFAGFRPGCRFEQLSKSEYPTLAPLRLNDLKTVFRYQDAQTNDLQLTQAVISSARALGATTACPARFISANQTTDGYSVCYQEEDEVKHVDCHCLVNAGGPWVNQIAQRIIPHPQPLKIDLVQGSHVLLRGSLANHCFYLEAPQDQRAVFALPWYGNTLVGTTETLFQGDPDEACPLPEEETYLLETVRHYFPEFEIDILDRFVGLRVLPHSDRRFFKRSRETQLNVDQQVIGIYGGKLTSYRSTAEKVVRQIQKILGKRTRIANTRNLQLKLEANEDSAPDASGYNAD